MSLSRVQAWSVFGRAVAFSGLLAATQLATAATLCVNLAGSAGCFSSVTAAVAAAKSNDTINIGSGSYAGNIVVSKNLSLVGAGAGSTIINAKGLANGIYVDGLDNGGLNGVIVTGMTVMNANFEGILVTNSSYVVISENHVVGNNQSLNVSGGTCPGLPVFETSEGFDCGEGVHLVGVDHSTIANNLIELNSGGILITDETAYTNDNVITGNMIRDNPFACGITLASHPPSPQAASPLPYGIFHNTIVGNTASGNGFGVAGDGAGVGIYAPGPGNLNFGNRVINNVLQNNGLPGVAIHNHAAPPGAPGINLDDNQIIGNMISGNAADTQDAATSGTAGINVFSLAPINGLVIERNIITNEAVDVVMNAPGNMTLHFNSLLGGKTGAANTGSGSINATMNYWGCATGPGTTGCASVTGGSAVISSPSLAAAPAGSSAPAAH